MQNQVLSVARHLQVAIRFLDNATELSEQGVDVVPFEIVRERMLKDPVVGAELRAGEMGDCFHGILGVTDGVDLAR
jgi:hypothetical protein